MGRGSSSSRHGGGGGAVQQQQQLPPPTNQVQLPQPDEVAKGNILPKGGVPYDQFEKMTNAQKAQVISDALDTGVPMFLDDSGMQRFAYFTGMANTPKVVSDAQLDGMKGHELFRTVNDAYNSRLDLGYKSTDIAEQITSGDFTMYSDSGGSAYGRAIYFASSVGSSSSYAKGANKHPVMIRAKVTGGKSIADGALTRQYNAALKKGDPIAKACSKAESKSSRNLYALAKGYDIITTNDYHMVLNRRCLTVSSKVKTGVQRGTNTW